MIIKRTLHYHKCLIFNNLRGFKDGGGGKNGQSIMWCKPFFLKKKNFSSRLKKFRKNKNYIYVCVYGKLYII